MSMTAFAMGFCVWFPFKRTAGYAQADDATIDDENSLFGCRIISL
jgi:hypothetical protein